MEKKDKGERVSGRQMVTRVVRPARGADGMRCGGTRLCFEGISLTWFMSLQSLVHLTNTDLRLWITHTQWNASSLLL